MYVKLLNYYENDVNGFWFLIFEIFENDIVENQRVSLKFNLNNLSKKRTFF